MSSRVNHGAQNGLVNTWQASTNLYDQARVRPVIGGGTGSATPSSPLGATAEGTMSMLKTVRPNIVQSIRAFRATDLAQAAAEAGQHFLYANCSHAQTKNEVLETIAKSFLFPKHFGKNFDALSDCLTDLVHKSGPQPGFVVVLEGLPCTPKFDKEVRETLLDVFREAADFWGDRKVQFRVFYAFV